MAQFILTPKGNADFAQNVDAARALVGQKLGLEMVDGSAAEYAALSQADQVRVADELAAFIVSQPQFFSELQVSLSTKRTQSPGFRSALSEYGFAQAAKDFMGEVANQAVSLNESVNPFSETNRKSLLTRVAVIAGVVAVLYFAGPRLIEAFRKTAAQ